MTQDRPTPPSPITATVAPAGTSAVLRTAPTPVETQQPMSAATAGSTPSGSGIAAASGTTVVAGHRADPAVRQHRLAGERRERGRAVREPVPERGRHRTRPGPAGQAPSTGAARHQPRQRDGLTDPQRPHARPDRVHDPGALVAHHDRRRSRPLAVPDVQVGVADAGGQDPHPDLAGPRLGRLERLDGDRAGRASGGRRRGSRSRLARPSSFAVADGRVRERRPATTSRRR